MGMDELNTSFGKDEELNITKITVSFGRTYNLGNFESLRLEAGLECVVKPGQKAINIVDKLWEEVEEIVLKEKKYILDK